VSAAIGVVQRLATRLELAGGDARIVEARAGIVQIKHGDSLRPGTIRVDAEGVSPQGYLTLPRGIFRFLMPKLAGPLSVVPLAGLADAEMSRYALVAAASAVVSRRTSIRHVVLDPAMGGRVQAQPRPAPRARAVLAVAPRFTRAVRRSDLSGSTRPACGDPPAAARLPRVSDAVENRLFWRLHHARGKA
jgi:hypothetical protein